MTFSFTKLATTALTGLAALGFASASYATPPAPNPRKVPWMPMPYWLRPLNARVWTLWSTTSLRRERPSVNGFYSSHNRVLVVCNDRYVKGENEDPQWTANDLDTLRHEAQHLIQDCMVGGLADSKLHPVYRIRLVLPMASLVVSVCRGSILCIVRMVQIMRPSCLSGKPSLWLR